MRRVLLTVFALVILLPSVAMAQAFLCRTDGQTRSHCCCKHKEAPPEKTVRRASCCDVTPAAAPRTTPMVIDHALPAPAATPAAIVIVPPTAPIVRIPDSFRSGAPPGAPPPLSVRLLL